MIPAEVYTERRKKLMKLLGTGVIVIPPNPKMKYSQDKYFKYRPNSNIFYLSGMIQEDTIIVLDNISKKSYLFLLDQDYDYQRWHGRKIDREYAGELSNFIFVYPIHELKQKLLELLKSEDTLYYQSGVNLQYDRIIEEVENEIEIKIKDPSPSIDTLRLFKDEYEIELLKKSASITVNGHLEAIRKTKIGMKEHEIESIYTGYFHFNGAILPMHQAIVASGENAIYLHHMAFTRQIQDGDLILVDTGCEYMGYTTDIARTWPANGKYSKSQKMIYEIVLRTHKICLEKVKPYVKFRDIHETAVMELTKGLIELKIINESLEDAINNESYKKYFMHYIGHFIGLDGHDSLTTNREEITLTPGMTITIEPGLYISDEKDIPEIFRNIGIRIEDNLLITETGMINLSKDLPIEIEEIENLMIE